MVINLHPYRYGIVVGLLFMFLPFIYKFGVEKPPEKVEKKQPLCGAFMTWQEVNEVFPLYAKVSVIDYDSKQTFEVQRRGGYHHADVQPLTAEDTAVMKGFCETWSWKRRAVVVKLENGQRIAASMACMPHGQGAIRGNNFNGHFCIHFRDSKVHASGRRDLAHQIMVWKSARVVEPQLKALNAVETLRVFFTAADQGDQVIPGRIMTGGESLLALNALSQLRSVKIQSMHKVDEENYTLVVRVVFKNAKRENIRKNSIVMLSTKAGWKIDPNSIIALLQ